MIIHGKIPDEYETRAYHRVQCTPEEAEEMRGHDPEHGFLKFIAHVVEDDGGNVIIYKWQNLEKLEK